MKFTRREKGFLTNWLTTPVWVRNIRMKNRQGCLD